MLTHRENYLRTARFQGPEYIPCSVFLSHALRALGGAELEEVMARHDWLWPGFRAGQTDFADYEFPARERVGELVDPWGCRWRCAVNGMVGTVVEHPLGDWAELESLPEPSTDPQCAQHVTGTWDQERQRVDAAKRRGDLTSGGLYHGFFFMRLTYLRGFENLMCDLAEEPPELYRLIDAVKAQCSQILRRWLQMDVDQIGFGEDLGTQTGPMISPEMFAKFVTPVYRELMQPARKAGKLVYLHTDGRVLELMDEFHAAGVHIINPQDLVNGIDNLAREVKGRFCIDLDVDRQSVVPFGTPGDIHALVEEEVRKLGDRAGGLMLKIGIYPPTPPRNVNAVCEAFRKFRTYFRD